MKAIVCSPIYNINFFNIVAGVLLGDAFVLCLFIICLDYVLQMTIDLIKENSFTLKKQETDDILQKTITDADYIDNLPLFINTSAQARARSINFYVNTNKTEFMCFK